MGQSSRWTPFQALPAYLGGKRQLVPLIFAALAKALPQSRWIGARFLDPFLGAGAVSLFAKARGFRVACNDIALRSALVGYALIENGTTLLTQADIVQLLVRPRGRYRRMAEQHFSPQVFSNGHAELLDRLLHQARTSFDPRKRDLALLVVIKWLLRCQPMSQLRGTDARAAATGDLDRVSPRRLGHYLAASKLLRPRAFLSIAKEVNAGVFPGDGHAFQLDAVKFLRQTGGDVVYLDPPYPGTTSYENEYGVLDVLLEGEAHERSRFSSQDSDFVDLFRAAVPIPIWIMSCNNAVLTLDQLEGLIRPFRPNITAVDLPYRHLGSIASEEKNATNREFIIVATA